MYLARASQEVRTESAIHDAVVAGERHAHSPAHGGLPSTTTGT